MFIQHKQLKSLNVSAEKVTHIQHASSSVQLAFAGFPPQLCQAYLMQIKGGDKVLIVVAFYLEDSCCSIFFVPKFGEISVEDAESVYEEGYSFVESMGFVLTETDYHLLPAQKKQAYWATLPVCRPPKRAAEEPAIVKDDTELKKHRQDSLNSLGRLFASM